MIIIDIYVSYSTLFVISAHLFELYHFVHTDPMLSTARCGGRFKPKTACLVAQQAGLLTSLRFFD